MRKFNAILTMVILVLFILHGVFGSLQMLGISKTALKTLAWANVGLIAVHVIISTKLTIDTLRIQRKAGAAYYRENKLFWARRISGFAVMILLVFHLTAFSQPGDTLRLAEFTPAKLITQLLLVAAIAVHVISNVRPQMIALGIKSLKIWVYDILIILSILIIFMSAALVVYYLRWNVF